MIVYISHAYGGKEENKLEAEKIVRQLVIDEPENTYLSPIHATGFLYNDVPYQQGLDMCLKLLSRCDCMRVYGNYEGSKGVKAEIRYCRENAIPYEIR